MYFGNSAHILMLVFQDRIVIMIPEIRLEDLYSAAYAGQGIFYLVSDP